MKGVLSIYLRPWNKFTIIYCSKKFLGDRLKKQPWITWINSFSVFYLMIMACYLRRMGLSMDVSHNPSWIFCSPLRMTVENLWCQCHFYQEQQYNRCHITVRVILTRHYRGNQICDFLILLSKWPNRGRWLVFTEYSVLLLGSCIVAPFIVCCTYRRMIAACFFQ